MKEFWIILGALALEAVIMIWGFNYRAKRARRGAKPLDPRGLI